MASNRLVGGLYCFDVLDRLSDYVDGELDAASRRQVESHLGGCSECTRFGGEFGAIVSALRERLKVGGAGGGGGGAGGAGGKGGGSEGSEADDVPSEVARRLDESLSR